MPWYRVGSVSITAGQNTVTGAGTNFSTNARVGDAFQGPDGRWYEVTNIASATVLSILPAYQGSTVSAGAYGLAPMQGYVKESADRLRQLVDQFGATLSLFGGATTIEALRQSILAATRGANSDITSLTGLTTALSVGQGGTGGNTPAAARASLGLAAAAVAAVLGTVSQSGGVPTGAIYERGSNANGEYVKFADGSAIAWVNGDTTSFSQQGQIWVSDVVTMNLPMAFTSTARMVVSAGDNFGPSVWSGGCAMSTTQIQARSFYFLTLSQVTRTIRATVTGRWF